MGILKIGQRISGVSSCCRQISCYSNGEGMGREENPVSEAESADDSEDYEITEVNCELGMVEGQLCNIPYELYDLPYLTEILSLDTWNSCLTEEERFSLSAYLPDMDQQTFGLTMKQLLGGSDLYFGSPMDIFFKRLKGGHIFPKVAHFRECLQFMQRRKYYHALRSYHDTMAQKFIDMTRVWDQCKMSAGVQERVNMWTTRGKHKGKDLLDLNTVPKDGYLLSEEVKSDAIMCHLPKRTRFVENKRANNILPSVCDTGMKFVAPNSSAKGLLKVKASGNGSFQNQNPKLALSNILEKSRSAPKGVLKLVPKVPSFQLEQSKVVPRRTQPALLVSTQGSQDRKFSSLPASAYFRDAYGPYESPFPRQTVCGSKGHTTPEQVQCVLNQQEDAIGTNRNSESSTLGMKREIDPLLNHAVDLGIYKQFAGDVGRFPDDKYESSIDTKGARRCTFGGENLWQTLSMGKEEFSVRSLQPHPCGIQYFEGEQRMEAIQEKHIIVHPRIPEVISRISDIGIGKQDTLMASSSDQMKGQSDVSGRKSEKLLSKPNVSEGFKDDIILPLTYKRRKTRAKVNSLDFSKSLTAGTDLKSGNLKESNQHLGESATAVKIKFTGWKDTSLNKEP